MFSISILRMLIGTCIGICGLGFVGDAVQHFFEPRVSVRTYDKYKNVGSFTSLLQTDVLFLCLPTPIKECGKFDTTELDSVIADLDAADYRGDVVIKSTVDATYLTHMDMLYPRLTFVHHPEFLTARTARQDFATPRQHILGVAKDHQKLPCKCAELLHHVFPDVPIHVVDYATAALVKLGCNAFYATKVQYFTMLYLLAQQTRVDYATLRQLMLAQGWINDMHTQVPGPDGHLSFGGLCLPKDTEALYNLCQEHDVCSHILAGVLTDQSITRN
jgi:UDPglucose 6-dehydrogenase